MSPINAIYGWEYAGVNGANGNPLYRKADGQIIQGNIPTATWVNYDPANQTNVSVPAASLTTSDKKIIGPSLPTYFGGIIRHKFHLKA